MNPDTTSMDSLNNNVYKKLLGSKPITMRNALMFWAIILSSLSLHGQDQSSKISFDLFFQPNTSSKKKVDGDATESAKYGYELGGGVNYYISNKFSITSGVSYQNKGYIYETGLVFNEPDVLINSNDKLKKTYNYYFLSIPLKAEYRIFSTNNFRIYINTGISGDIMIRQDIDILYITNGTKLPLSTLHNKKDNIYLSGTVGVKFLASICKNISIYLQPNFDFQLNQPNSEVKNYKYKDLGLRIGMNYQL